MASVEADPNSQGVQVVVSNDGTPTSQPPATQPPVTHLPAKQPAAPLEPLPTTGPSNLTLPLIGFALLLIDAGWLLTTTSGDRRRRSLAVVPATA